MKGDFLTKDGENVKLIINSDKKPIILITANNNNKIYYSSKNQSNQQIFNLLKNAIKK